MISWKYSFEEISKDLELAKKKKQALDDLFNAGKISASTYESLNKELAGVISEIEARQKILAEKMTSKITELEQQVSTLEIFLANSEIQYAAGEIDEDLHARESNAFTLGLEAMKQQLGDIKNVVIGIMPKIMAPTPPVLGEIAKAPPTEEVFEKAPEIPAEAPIEAPVEVPVEAESVSEEATTEHPMEAPAEETLAEESLEAPPETLEEEMLEEEAPSEEEFLSSEEAPTEEETETAEDIPIYEEEATTEEETEE